MSDRVTNIDENSNFTFGSASRPYKGEYYNGDLIMVRPLSATSSMIAVIDVAGHGKHAHDVARFLEDELSTALCADLVGLVTYLHQELLGKQHTAMIVGRLDHDEGVFSYIHVGDVHGKVEGGRRRTLTGQLGRVGMTLPVLQMLSETLLDGDLLMLCTDGISERFDIGAITNALTQTPESLSRSIVDRFGKAHDDASCLVVRFEQSEY